MPLKIIEGTQGSVTLPTGHAAKLSYFTVAVGMNIVDITGFDSAGWAEMLGSLKSLSGSARGRMKYDAASTDPGFTAMVTTGGSMTLQFSGGAGTACSLTFTAMISGISASEDAHGEAEVTFNFVSSGAVTGSWDVT